MSYNNGKVSNIEEITDIEKAIEDFSEGDIYLQKLLLECYYNNIKTVACCAGHKEDECFPYIAFSCCDENEQVLYYLMTKLKDSGVLFTFNKNSTSASYFNLEFRDYDTNYFKEVLKILDLYDKTKDYFKELPQDLQTYFNIIKSINNSKILDVEENSPLNYFQLHYIQDQDTYSYFSFSNNYECISSLIEGGFIRDGDNEFIYYSIDSVNREDNNEVLQRFKISLDQRIDENFISNFTRK